MNKLFYNVPLPNRNYSDEYDCGDGAYMLIYDNVDKTEFDEYFDFVLKTDYSLFQSNDIDGNCHFTFKGEKLLHIYYAVSEAKIRVVADENIPNYSVNPIKTGKYKTTLWQFEVDHSLIDCGMCYIIRCDDNSFFIIDSAHYYSVNDDRRIIEFLQKMSGEEKPRVSGWFFSHAHEDHIGIFNDILKYHNDKIVIENIYVNFPSPTHRDAPWEIPFFNMMCIFRELLSEYKEINVVKLHTGMHFCVRNLEFDVLCTHEDVHPESTQDFNNTSTVLMMTAQGTKVSFPGDASTVSDKILISRYNDFLSCDIVQISHHGHTGTSPEFYRRSNAKCALFPVTVIKYDEEYPRQESNRIAVTTAEEVYIASNGTVEIDLPYSVGNVKELPDETFEDFDGIFNLWCYQYTDERKKELYDEYLRRSSNNS